MTKADEAAAPCARAPRKDAARNREALLQAGGELYAERGIDASLEEIAKRAGVGIGTLYRHFPTRDALNEAVYRREVDALCDRADELAASGKPPVEALADWMRAFARYVARKRGMAMALKSALGPDNELFNHSSKRVRAALGKLLDAAVATGEIRADVEQEDLMRALHGICMTNDSADCAERSARTVGLLVDGLRYGAPSS